jgi:hypothetical protein
MDVCATHHEDPEISYDKQFLSCGDHGCMNRPADPYIISLRISHAKGGAENRLPCREKKNQPQIP